MHQQMTAVWHALPGPVRQRVRRTGVPYLASYVARYHDTFRADRFAGNLAELSGERWRAASGSERERLAAQVDRVLDSLVLPNGVRKTTYARRQSAALAGFVAGEDRFPDGTAIRVLDVPSSSGVSSLDSYEVLRRLYPIEAWVLSDLCLEVYYDPERRCVYDEDGNLLQVQGRHRFYSVHRPHASGDVSSLLTRAVLSPLALRSWYLRRRLTAPGSGALVRVGLVHPEVRALVEQGVFTLRRADVFALDWREEFDLVLSFNLLQRNYFPPPLIERGLANLTRALREGGYLITGNTESFGIARKENGRLRMLHREGDW